MIKVKDLTKQWEEKTDPKRTSIEEFQKWVDALTLSEFSVIGEFARNYVELSKLRGNPKGV
jgi:hypothetical protein